MGKKIKVILIMAIVMLSLPLIIGASYAIKGGYFAHASFINVILATMVGAIFLYVIGKAIKFIWTYAFVAIILLQSCNYAKSNQQVVVSSDCGMTWEVVRAGDAVPKAGVNQCYMKVVMPNYPMQGDSRFITNLKDRVRAFVHIDYDYSITDPLAFIKQAKYLGKANSDADSEEALNSQRFEGAENMIIDKRIKDISKSMFVTEDIVELDQTDLENALQAASNKVLEAYGVRLNFITLTFDLDDQTRQAIDISTAMKIYDSKGLSDIGKQVMVARAGAAKISVEAKLPESATPVEK